MKTYSPLLVYQQLVEVYEYTNHNILIIWLIGEAGYHVALSRQRTAVRSRYESPNVGMKTKTHTSAVTNLLKISIWESSKSATAADCNSVVFGRSGVGTHLSHHIRSCRIVADCTRLVSERRKSASVRIRPRAPIYCGRVKRFPRWVHAPETVGSAPISASSDRVTET